MPSKRDSKSKTPAASSKPQASSSKATRKAPQPQPIQRFWGDVICVVGFPRATEEALGPKLLEEVIAEMNKTGIRFVFQDEHYVVNLTTQVLAIRN
jgi:hypothetical protein